MGKQKDYIITSLQSWDIEIGSSIKNVALELSKTDRVLYINSPMDHVTRLRGEDKPSYRHRLNVLKGRVPTVRQINENMWVIDCPFMIYSVNKLPTRWLFDFINKLNNKKIARRIREAIKEFNFQDYRHLNDMDIYRSFYMKELLKPALSIYYYRDIIITQSYWKKNGARLEPLLEAKSDLVIANSPQLRDRALKNNPYSYETGTGVNLELYDVKKEWTIPADLSPIPHPIVGYVGSIDSRRLDSDLLYTLAKSCPDYNMVFVGPEDDHFRKHPLHELSNVYFLGGKPVDTLPAYISGFDVCINPQLVNDLTDGNYPLKIDEYLAMGKPVVATSTSAMRDIFSTHTYLASNAEEYKTLITQALEESDNAERKTEYIRFAHTHSWTNSVKQINQIIDHFLGN